MRYLYQNSNIRAANNLYGNYKDFKELLLPTHTRGLPRISSFKEQGDDSSSSGSSNISYKLSPTNSSKEKEEEEPFRH